MRAVALEVDGVGVRGQRPVWPGFADEVESVNDLGRGEQPVAGGVQGIGRSGAIGCGIRADGSGPSEVPVRVVDARVDDRHLHPGTGDPARLHGRRPDLGHGGRQRQLVVGELPNARDAGDHPEVVHPYCVDGDHERVVRLRHAPQFAAAEGRHLCHHGVLCREDLRGVGALVSRRQPRAQATVVGARGDHQGRILQANGDTDLAGCTEPRRVPRLDDGIGGHAFHRSGLRVDRGDGQVLLARTRTRRRVHVARPNVRCSSLTPLDVTRHAPPQ